MTSNALSPIFKCCAYLLLWRLSSYSYIQKREWVNLIPLCRHLSTGFVPLSLSLMLLGFHSCYFTSYTYPITMSSYDPIPVDGIITQEQFKASMKLVRLQIAVPISVLASISANIVCALAIKPGLRRSIASLHIMC